MTLSRSLGSFNYIFIINSVMNTSRFQWPHSLKARAVSDRSNLETAYLNPTLAMVVGLSV